MNGEEGNVAPRSSARPRYAALIVAAGRGHRSGLGLPKQYAKIGGMAVLRRTLLAFQEAAEIDVIRCVIHPDDRALYDEAVAGLSGIGEPIAGGATRQISVRLGLEALSDERPEIVLIHDAARAFVSRELIARMTTSTDDKTGAVPTLALSDSLKHVEDGVVLGTIERSSCRAVQTPQAFPFQPILDAHRAAAERDDLTDDAAVAEAAGLHVRSVEGDERNIKLTTSEDFARAAAHLAPVREYRAGQGFDVHAFCPGDHVFLCGVKIDHDMALEGHSDADVGLHALTDAIYGAIGEGDIGQHFPPSDPQWKGADSEIFLKAAVERVTARGGAIVNVDVTLICEAPKVGPHREAMSERLSEMLGIARHRINVKATTSEKLGFTGRREGIAALAAVSVALPGDGDA
ncbi:bifunctional 2-C-methyl-D-erythritol 4-phosphate cytidylyltransferase/2-C-methyl-D-erythritol 2,4-cyclodiphosphate synthase [Afifella aestuarii]|uniref:bifunctional 2-C-methyl-D-erythritol 4-phosphate cytidylyltransferase/2-C-methyl-D-erythritol 2,4-cyclodiphosphate synthase n=1 Tax=Afifella aestuarii TaxID=1909496 RepID=UPI000FE2E3A9|nr:bifunctional 2-C-methyl-D-erythritol 4-phosphate cytidylyltransferase/2-C-methyl-D-erythritol 2,4-cyclodiphosphate synthase [Afifella aestuarii]